MELNISLLRIWLPIGPTFSLDVMMLTILNLNLSTWGCFDWSFSLDSNVKCHWEGKMEVKLLYFQCLLKVHYIKNSTLVIVETQTRFKNNNYSSSNIDNVYSWLRVWLRCLYFLLILMNMIYSFLSFGTESEQPRYSQTTVLLYFVQSITLRRFTSFNFSNSNKRNQFL